MSRRFSALLLLLQLLILSYGPEPAVQAPAGDKPPPTPCSCSPTSENCCRRFQGLTNLTHDKLRPCSPSWRRLDLSLNSIVAVSAFNTSSCAQLRELILFMNKIDGDLRSNYFSALTNLERLNLSRNNVSRLWGIPFAGLKKLKTLDLSHNVIRVLSKTSFSDLESLEVLRLFGNYIGFIAQHTFAGLVRLKVLDLTENNITGVRTTSFRGLTSLEQLYLQRNPIKELKPQVFYEMTNLQTLTLGICGKIGEVPRLEGNLFTKLTRLTTFNFSSCLIGELHRDAFRGLGALRKLSLRSNRLVRINRTVWEPLMDLIVLDLAHNRLECLYDSNFYGLSRLIELDLSGNRINYLADATFIGLTQLQRLRLDGNPLRVVQPGALCRAPLLSYISLLEVPMNGKLGLGPPGGNGTLNDSFSALRKDARIILPGTRKAHGLATACRPVLPGRAQLTSNVCPVFLGRDPMRAHSRQYLLISVAVCVTFLLMALGVIMSYRAWSKRKRTACEKAEQAALEEEKQEMMAKPSAPSGAANGGGSATKELLAAGQSPENGVVLHERYAPLPTSSAGEAGTPSVKEEKGDAGKDEDEEHTMTHLAVV